MNDKITKIKLSEAIDYTDTATKGKVVKDKHVVALMRYYELIKEIKNVNWFLSTNTAMVWMYPILVSNQ